MKSPIQKWIENIQSDIFALNEKEGSVYLSRVICAWSAYEYENPESYNADLPETLLCNDIKTYRKGEEVKTPKWVAQALFFSYNPERVINYETGDAYVTLRGNFEVERIVLKKKIAKVMCKDVIDGEEAVFVLKKP